jgi:hypothetical protein
MPIQLTICAGEHIFPGTAPDTAVQGIGVGDPALTSTSPGKKHD